MKKQILITLLKITNVILHSITLGIPKLITKINQKIKELSNGPKYSKNK